MESIDGILTKVMHHKPSKWSAAGVPYLIGALHNGTVVKGQLRRYVLDDRYRFYGDWKPDRKFPDRQTFEFTTHEVLIDQSIDGMTAYLTGHVPGIGKARAAALVDHFGLDVLHVLRTAPEKAIEVKGITEDLAESIRQHFQEDIKIDPAAYARLIDLFVDHKVPKRVVTRLLEDWGSDAPDKILDNPYTLLAYPRMSWELVDSFATTRAGYDPAGLERHKAAIMEAMDRIANDGHTVAEKTDIEEIAFQLVAARPVAQAWEGLLGSRKIVACPENDGAGREHYALAKLAAAEREIAERLADLAAHARPLEIDHRIDGLNEDQQAAVKLIAENGVAVLAGAPGVGKSFTMAYFLKAIVDGELCSDIKITAPTGKAAKRAAELLGDPRALGSKAKSIPCTTIHRALGPTPSDADEGVPSSTAKVGRGRDEFGFTHNADNPIEADYVITDEASMADVKLAAAFLRAIPLGCRLLILGDPNQLPSVGPGSFLRDVIAAGIPTATLTKIVRSDGGGRVVRACHAIIDGKMPEPAASLSLPTENWIHIEVDDPNAIADEIVGLHAKIQAGSKLNLDPMWDMQVVSAQKGRHAFGCENLNARLSQQLNPPRLDGDGRMAGGAGTDAGESPAIPFRVGDKVVRRKNGLVDEMIAIPADKKGGKADWTWDEPVAQGGAGSRAGEIARPPGDADDLADLDAFAAPARWKLRESMIVNGDMGTVVDIVPGGRNIWVVVRFRTPERLCRLPLGECHLERAYAITVHTAQGSGFPYTIVPVHSSFFWDHKKDMGLWSRELVYTAISRAERILVTVGQMEAIRTAIGRKTIGQRRTQLVERIREVQAERAARLDAAPADDKVAQPGQGGTDTGHDDPPAIERYSL